MKEAIVIGGGAAGMMFAARASERGVKVTLIEKNEKLGKKVYITGKGRCNFTNVCDPEEFLNHVLSNRRFLYSAIYSFSPEDCISQFEKWGMQTKIERGRRAFPASDHSADVIDALKRAMKRGKVHILLNTEATGLVCENGAAAGVKIRDGQGERILSSDFIVVACGGLSYPSTGSTGDGFRFAAMCGHSLIPTRPSLVPVVCREEYIREMQGLSLKNVELHAAKGKKEIFSDFGELMFTHFGITGPLVLSLSARIGSVIGKETLECWIDLKPALSLEMLDGRLIRLFSENPNKKLRNLLGELFPSKMIPVIPIVSGLDAEKCARDMTKEERQRLISAAKHFPVTMTALRGYNEAVVTSGGVSTKEVHPGTMESKLISGLYFIGEVLDLDAYTGGYNLQIAWSTACLCAEAAAVRRR